MRTIRLLAIAGPAPAMEGVHGDQPEVVYAVASDETFWTGEWKKGEFAWRELPGLPQAPAIDANTASATPAAIPMGERPSYCSIASIHAHVDLDSGGPGCACEHCTRNCQCPHDGKVYNQPGGTTGG